MVRDAGGAVTFLTLEQLVPYDKDKGRLAKVKAPEIIVKKRKLLKLLCRSKILA